MKGRSHRLQSSDPPDDWIDGSWTVDCICGVNFDDGEEMVNCDECGVWVHTRCSRYVKGDDRFACDKCKSKINRSDIEETEVAQLLAELPTKPIRMENSFVPNVTPRRPFKLWTDIPMEERVHIQGIPGGDPSLFGGLSIYKGEVWKCRGYVPKKFNFQYREFPCWDEGSKNEEENENPVDRGAGVLCSLSKESILASPIAALVDMRARERENGFDLKKSFKEMKKCDAKDTEAVRHVQNGMKKERSLLRSVVHSGKQKKEESGTSSKERSGKKRVKTSEKEADPKRRSSHSSKTAFTPTSDAKQLEFYEDRGPKIFKTDTWSIKNKNLKDVVVQDHISNDHFAVDTIMEEPNINLATTEDSSEALYPDTTRHSFSAGQEIAEEKTEHRTPVVEISSRTGDTVSPLLKHNFVGNAPIEEQEGDGLAVDNADDSIVVRSTMSPPVEDLCGPAPEHKDNMDFQDFNLEMCPSSQSKSKVKRAGDDDNSRKHLISHSSTSDLKYDEKLPNHISDHVNDTAATNSPSCENKLEDIDRKLEVLVDCHTNNSEELSGDFCHGKQELEESEGTMETQKGFPEIKDGSSYAEQPSKSETVCTHKMLSCLGKTSLSSSTMNTKIPANDQKSEETEIPNPPTKHGVMVDCNMHNKKESNQNDVRDEVPRKFVRERPKSSLNGNSKVMHSSKSTQNSVSKQVSSDARDSVNCSSKASLAHQTATNLGLSESNASSVHQKALQAPNKVSSSVPPRGEKLNQTNFQPSSKVNQNHVPSPSPTSNSSAMLSDEELALLLHQELNSSPRVPRVPRARHGPQLTSPSAASMLMKRTSSAGGKDHCSFSRRKYKDASRDGPCSSRELEDEAKRIENVSSSFEQKKQDMEYGEDAPVKEEGHVSMTTIKNVAPASSATANSSPSSPTEDRILSFVRNSPRNISDDDTGAAGRPVHRTLPGLINEIMSKGRRITYEELCNAVLPHWHNLRKHNGERYAYSSHSQAVLDCLRNRHEWARLVDRGPKTNSTRKRRKLEVEESDDNGNSKGRSSKGAEGKNIELQKEEFPKGKRKARKRRRLVLQGIAVKDVRKKKADSLTDEDVGPFSNSSEEESMFSEDEIQGDRTCPIGGSEPSASSDEAESA
ncbi:uncharacterized protein G2W53_019249 [Senna tora]|uniref:Zinc finger PHD-type domain-containing protein n=1 Tax=Senna tora TaxID=362788 RepID=A0A834TXG3_9FABA|nr:uncharacterized protein G2W53_019249 [Senna tora]